MSGLLLKALPPLFIARPCFEADTACLDALHIRFAHLIALHGTTALRGIEDEAFSPPLDRKEIPN